MKCNNSISLQEIPGAESSIVFEGPKPLVHVVSLANVGRCDHTYAYWIEQVMLATQGARREYTNQTKVLYSNHRYSGSPFRAIANIINPTDLIVFTKDTNNSHHGDDGIGGTLDVLDILTAQEQPSSPVATSYSSLKQSNFSKPITRGMACHDNPPKYKNWQHTYTNMVRRPQLWMFSKQKYFRLERDKNDDFKSPPVRWGVGSSIYRSHKIESQTVFSSDYYEQVVKGLIERDGGEYYERNTINATFEPDLAPICFGGIFATY